MRMSKYEPNPIDTSEVVIPDELLELSEQIAKNVHEVWSAGRIAEGWVYGKERNDERMETPCLIPYEELPEIEKDYDRHTAMETIKLILKLGYKIEK